MKRFLAGTLNAGFIVLGILSAGMGLKGFLLSSNFIDGGVTGVSMLLAKTTPPPLVVWLPAVNLPFIVVGYRQMGRAFALRSALTIAALAAVLALVWTNSSRRRRRPPPVHGLPSGDGDAFQNSSRFVQRPAATGLAPAVERRENAPVFQTSEAGECGIRPPEPARPAFRLHDVSAPETACESIPAHGRNDDAQA